MKRIINKRIFIMIPVMIMALMLTSARAQEYSISDLKKMIAVLNSECPTSLGMAGMLESVTLDHNAVVMNSKIDLPGINVGNTANLKIDFKDLFQTSLSSTFEFVPQSKLFYESIAGNGMNLKITSTYTDNSKFSIELTPEDIYKCLQSSPDYKKIVEYNQLFASNSFPLTVGPMTFTRSYIDKSGYVTEVIVDESQINMDMLESNKSTMKESSLNVFRQGKDVTTILTSYQTAKAGYALVYDYIGSDTGKAVRLIMTPEEVLEAVNLNL